ncbi:MAG TPA: hypothetical protein VN672_11540 [Solirubrobacteraceae bacterium]|nr:hypothetical protein [Solirubrobacteraceae bacterium]
MSPIASRAALAAGLVGFSLAAGYVTPALSLGLAPTSATPPTPSATQLDGVRSVAKEVPAAANEVPAVAKELSAVTKTATTPTTVVPTVTKQLPTITTVVPTVTAEAPPLTVKVPTATIETPRVSTNAPVVGSRSAPSVSATTPSVTVQASGGRARAGVAPAPPAPVGTPSSHAKSVGGKSGAPQHRPEAAAPGSGRFGSQRATAPSRVGKGHATGHYRSAPRRARGGSLTQPRGGVPATAATPAITPAAKPVGSRIAAAGGAAGGAGAEEERAAPTPAPAPTPPQNKPLLGVGLPADDLRLLLLIPLVGIALTILSVLAGARRGPFDRYHGAGLTAWLVHRQQLVRMALKWPHGTRRR